MAVSVVCGAFIIGSSIGSVAAIVKILKEQRGHVVLVVCVIVILAATTVLIVVFETETCVEEVTTYNETSNST